MINALPEKELFMAGHTACAGCAAPMVARTILKIGGPDTVVCNATGCMEVFTTPYPRTSWSVPWIHSAFENAAAVASGVDKGLKKKGVRDRTNVVVLGGDGGTFDIGFGAISGMLERGHKITYVCYDNGAYMNTGIQRSGATPKYSNTTTTPAGRVIHGKTEFSKPLPFIVAAHGAYVATASVAFLQDFAAKLRKAFAFNGPSYIQIFAPCPTGWRHPTDQTIEIAKLAFKTNAYPLYEIENGVLKLSRKPTQFTPVDDYLMRQGRFKHLSKEDIADVQQHVNAQWERLLKLEESKIKMF
ncbi:pyruvate synthase subunit beta [Candidatus Woesearchaeota archaeon]|nr:pyruvate synthase subunit beta [Candidatus Woesearchaeota archaeon]